jgi:UPF0042 nucleotide-binding protein
MNSTQQSNPDTRPLLVVVTGLSGAGLSTVINALSDVGFYCIDNLPIELIWPTVELMESRKIHTKGFALGMDIRDKKFAQTFTSIKEKLKTKLRLDIVYLEADQNVLATRYSATRRKHPLTSSADTNISKAIQRESKLLEPVKNSADVVFNTSVWSPHFLARTVEQRYSADLPPRQLHVLITSFGFKYGILKQCDEIFDVRFLANPYFSPELKNKHGLQKEVADYVFNDPAASTFLDKLVEMHEFLLPLYFREGKHYFRVGIGCTGGKHRSVSFAIKLAEELKKKKISNIEIRVDHRDVEQPDLVTFE